jgi:hypothetical protein
MTPLPQYPTIYEINTWVWLDELSRKARHPLTLAAVPDAEWDAIAALGFDAVWLMGVRERSPEGIRIAMANAGLLADFRRALPDFTDEDNVGSPYCVRRYEVDGHLGGPEGLAAAHRKLAERGMLLVLDFVPNHVAPDHPWAVDHPEYFIQGPEEDLRNAPGAYWDLEWELQQQGFDYCYDKRLYDRLEHDRAESVRLHLGADLAHQEKLVRFLENHDEPRAAATFSAPQHRAAAVVAATLPGARLFHEGQLEGRHVRLPVFLARRPVEPVDLDLKAFYTDLLKAIRAGGFREGAWRLCELSGWPDNAGYLNLVAWCWQQGKSRCLIVVNLSDMQSQALVRVPWEDLVGRDWLLRDLISGVEYRRNGNQMMKTGLYVDLEPWGYHFFNFM